MSQPNPTETNGGDRKARMLCLVGLPPPVTGRTVATSRFLSRLERLAMLTVVNLSATDRSAAASRVGKALKSVLWIFRLAFGASRRFDHVYIVANHGSGLWFDIAFATMARVWGSPVVVHHHVFSYFTRRKRRVSLLFRLTGNRSHHLLLCERMRSACAELYRTSAKLTVMPNTGSGTSAVDESPAPSRSSLPLEIVMVSNLTREKGIAEVLALARRFSERSDVVLRVAGPAMNEEIRRSIEQCSSECNGTLEWLGPVDAAARSELLSRADLFLFPTRYANEAQPLVLIEALEAGVPVVANARGCIAEMIGPKSDLLVEDESAFIESASKIIERMLADGEYRASLRRRAPACAAAIARRSQQALEQFAAELQKDRRS